MLSRAATWRAARSGLDGPLIDPITALAVPAPAMVRALLDHCRSALEERDEWDTVVELTDGLLARGPSTRRQRDALGRGSSPSDIVAALVAETTDG